jgi:ribosomal protein S18 acetylase RimI-like enzyme
MDTIETLGEIGLGSRMKQLSEFLMKEAQTIYNEQNIDFDPYLFPVFYQVSSHDEITNTTLCEVLLISQPAVTQTINKLLQKDLVILKNDALDKRKKQISLSQKGRILLIQLKPLWKMIDETIKEYSTIEVNSIIQHINYFEDNLHSGKIGNAIREKIQNQPIVKVVPYEAAYADYFYDFNIAWLEKYFYVEPFDKEVLSQAEKYILDPGGYIFFAVEGDKVMGTVALLIRDNNAFELTKMAVSPEFQGKKVGQILMQYCIDFAKEKRFKKLFLYSNRTLENAIHIYRKFGFIEVEIEADSPYERSNIKMDYPLK